MKDTTCVNCEWCGKKMRFKDSHAGTCYSDNTRGTGYTCLECEDRLDNLDCEVVTEYDILERGKRRWRNEKI